MLYIPEIGQKIKQLRTQRRISQITLANTIGVSRSVISSYENEVHMPPYDVLVRLALLFGVSTDYLLGVPSYQSINVDGLTDTQIKVISLIVSELREKQR